MSVSFIRSTSLTQNLEPIFPKCSNILLLLFGFCFYFLKRRKSDSICTHNSKLPLLVCPAADMHLLLFLQSLFPLSPERVTDSESLTHFVLIPHPLWKASVFARVENCYSCTIDSKDSKKKSISAPVINIKVFLSVIESIYCPLVLFS